MGHPVSRPTSINQIHQNATQRNYSSQGNWPIRIGVLNYETFVGSIEANYGILHNGQNHDIKMVLGG